VAVVVVHFTVAAVALVGIVARLLVNHQVVVVALNLKLHQLCLQITQ
jgi:hypothetical protein